MNNEYTVKPIKPDVYEVYKFEHSGDERPITVYTLTTFNSKFKCNCPSGKYRGYCGHSDMVKEYRRLERKYADIHPFAMITFRK